MYKVFRMTSQPIENFTQEEIEDTAMYTNYADDFMELPDINDTIPNFNEEVGFSDDDEAFGRVVYVCNSVKDVQQAFEAMDTPQPIGGIEDPVEIQYQGKDYVFDIDEWMGNSILFPKEIAPELIAIYKDDEDISDFVYGTLGYEEDEE